MNNLLKLHRFSTQFDDAIATWGGAIVLTWLRCYVGWQFFHSGLIKLQNWPGTLELFRSEYHVPLLPPELAAYMGAGGELLFPCLLVLGLFARPAAIGLFMVNAMAVISYPQLFEFECPAAINDHFYWAVMLIIVAAMGAGGFSVDSRLKKITSKV